MPGMTGTDFAQRLAKIAPYMQVVLLSGLAEAGLRARAQMANIRAVVEKPVWPEALCRVVAQALAYRPPEARKDASILVVDDDRAHCDACARMLKHEGYT